MRRLRAPRGKHPALPGLFRNRRIPGSKHYHIVSGLQGRPAHGLARNSGNDLRRLHGQWEEKKSALQRLQGNGKNFMRMRTAAAVFLFFLVMPTAPARADPLDRIAKKISTAFPQVKKRKIAVLP